MLENCFILAQTESASGFGAMGSMIVPFLLIGAMMFFMFRSQKKEASRRTQMLDTIRIDDKVLTAGGIIGIVKVVNENSFLVEIAEKVKVEISKTGVNSVITEESK